LWAAKMLLSLDEQIVFEKVKHSPELVQQNAQGLR
jgi:hypothetical protein